MFKTSSLVKCTFISKCSFDLLSKQAKFLNHSKKCLSLLSTAVEDNQIASNKTESTLQQNSLFNDEKKRQQSLIGRIQKIEVRAKDLHSNEATLMMNANISTPFHCSQHLHELISQRSVAAKIDDQHQWDMNRPLERSCSLTFLHLREENPFEANKIFWRSCSFLLGMVIEKTFKDEIPVILHSWPKPDIRSGSFVYDVELPTLPNWSANDAELRTLTAMFWKLRHAKMKFERLEVDANLAKDIFKHNKHKLSQLDEIAGKNNDSKIVLYRLNDHIDFSVGPMIPDTAFLGRVSVTAVHRLQSKIDNCERNLYRFQGIAVPAHLKLNFFAYQLLTERSKKLNHSSIPN